MKKIVIAIALISLFSCEKEVQPSAKEEEQEEEVSQECYCGTVVYSTLDDVIVSTIVEII